MEAEVETTLRGIVQNLLKSEFWYCIQSVHLYGSRARGDNRPDSDVDVAIIFDDFIYPFLDHEGLPDGLVGYLSSLRSGSNLDIQFALFNGSDFDDVASNLKKYMDEGYSRGARCTEENLPLGLISRVILEGIVLYDTRKGIVDPDSKSIAA